MENRAVYVQICLPKNLPIATKPLLCSESCLDCACFWDMSSSQLFLQRIWALVHIWRVEIGRTNVFAKIIWRQEVLTLLEALGALLWNFKIYGMYLNIQILLT